MTIIFATRTKEYETRLTRLIPIQRFPHIRPKLQYCRIDPLLYHRLLHHRRSSSISTPTHAPLGRGLTLILAQFFFGRWLTLLLRLRLLLGAWRWWRRWWWWLWSNHIRYLHSVVLRCYTSAS
jgi:hypothetical protein